MNVELEKKLIADLEKSGFSSELRAIRTFLSCGWQCTGFANYFDLDEEKIRAVDLRASSEQTETLSNNIRVGVEYLIEAEIKKSNNPWIVFKEKIGYLLDDYMNNLVYLCNIRPPYRYKDAMAAESLYTQFGWKAYNLHESLKPPNEYSRSHTAMITVSKSAESMLEAASAAYKELEQISRESGDPLNERVLVFVKPILILDGLLMAANLSDTGQISLEEIKFAPIEFYYTSKHCRKGQYLIDIVTLDNLKEYIEISERRRQAMFDRIKSRADSGAT